MNHKRAKKVFKKSNLKIQVQRAGGIYTARYHGRAEKVFGATPEEATKRLQDGR